MCTAQMYRVVDLNKADKNNPRRQAVYIYSNSKHDIEDVFPFPHYLKQAIPCGKCIECRLSKAQEWAFRCMKECAEYKDNIMVTLTYDDEHLPKGVRLDPKTGEVLGESLTLPDHEEIQKFMKRLRKVYGDGVKLYGCGEYGSDKEYKDWKGNIRQATERPHYHIILFNVKVDDLKFWKYSYCEWAPKIKNPLYKSATMSKLWKKGHVDLNEVNYETCCYVAGYVMKKWKGRGSDEHYLLKGQKPPYTFMSRRPGIGHAFFERNKDKFFNEDTFWQVTKKGLKEIRPGRYFDKLMEKEDEQAFSQIKNSREKKSLENTERLMQKTDITRHEYIENKESKNKLRTRFMKRSLI